MRTLPLVLVLVAALVVAGGASAQSLGTVIFQPTGAQVYQAAFDPNPPVLAPIPASDPIGFTIQARGRATAVVSGLPATGFRIIAKYTSGTKGAVPSVVLSPRRQTVFDGFVRRYAQVRASYQLVLTGPLAPGTRTITVSYHLAGARSVHHTIQVTIPPVVALQLDGGNSVSFDYTGDPAAYVAAWGSTLAPTAAGTTLRAVKVYSNGGYVVSVTARAAFSNPGANGVPLSRLAIKGHVLSAAAVTIAAAATGTGGLLSVATPADYSLAVNGSEGAGSYRYTVEYAAVSP